MPETLDDLLDGTEPHATFHDAHLLEAEHHDEDATMRLQFDLCVGDPDGSDPERRRPGNLLLTGVGFWVVDPPGSVLGIRHSGMHWLTSDGPITDLDTPSAKRLSQTIPAGSLGWYLFFSDGNAFAYLCAKTLTFSWKTADVVQTGV